MENRGLVASYHGKRDCSTSAPQLRADFTVVERYPVTFSIVKVPESSHLRHLGEFCAGAALILPW
jgi:hypothetical protein